MSEKHTTKIKTKTKQKWSLGLGAFPCISPQFFSLPVRSKRNLLMKMSAPSIQFFGWPP